MLLRRAYPWIASIAVHAVCLSVPWCLRPVSEAPKGGGLLVFELSPPQAEDREGPEEASEGKTVRRKPDGEIPEAARRSKRRRASAVNPLELPRIAEETRLRENRPEEEGEKTLSADIGWEGMPRTLLSRPRLSFPKSLREYGLEAECEARISVSPSGTVVDVEILKSSGYTEIDASVETALRGYVFARDYGLTRENAVGNVRIRFRLEKPD
jgi:TonB family protein